MKLSRKDYQFIAICVGAVVLFVIAAYLIQPPIMPTEDIPIVQAEDYAYVALVNSEVFHEPDCRSAKKIRAYNLTGFESRKDAVNSGRRPCEVCKP